MGFTTRIKGRGGPRWTTFSCSCSVVVQAPAQPVRWCVVCKAWSGLAIWVGLLLVPPNGQPSGFNTRGPNSIARMPSGKQHDRIVCKKAFCNVRQCHSKVRANILDAAAPLMLCGNVPDWPAKCVVSGFVFGAVFWAAFFMPAAAKAENLPRRGRSFGTAEFSFLGSCFWLQVFVYLRARKTDPGTFKAHHAEADSATGIRLANLAPEIMLSSNLNQLKR